MQSRMTPTTHSKLKCGLRGREARIVLTPACNYRCVFCHHEGLDTSTTQEWKPSHEAIRSILDGALDAGCEDITLTGGEPLLFKPIVLEIIRHVHAANPAAKVTIVSNASLLNEPWLAEAAASRTLRMNVSIHSADPDAYRFVTAQDAFSLPDIVSRLSLLRQYNVPFKLNAVALRKRNDTAAQIAALCAFSQSHGASALKILELLVMESCESLFPDYVASDTLARLLPPSYSFAARTTRRDEYLCSETGFRVEIQKCRCRFGCRRCAKEGTACFTSDGSHVPCFEYSDRRIPAQGSLFISALAEGDAHLNALADKFGDASPSLVKDIRFSERRRDAFFIVHDTSAVQSLVDQAEHVEKFSFVEIHLAPPSQEIPTTRAAHIRIHDSDPENARLILATRILESEGDGLHVSSAIFFDPAKIPMQGNEAFLLAATRHLGWHTSRCVRFKGDAYVDTHDGDRFSIATVANSIQTLRIDCTTPPGLTLARRLLNTQGLSHVDTLFTQFLANRGTQTEN